jgi:hypothetical protein
MKETKEMKTELDMAKVMDSLQQISPAGVAQIQEDMRRKLAEATLHLEMLQAAAKELGIGAVELFEAQRLDIPVVKTIKVKVRKAGPLPLKQAIKKAKKKLKELKPKAKAAKPKPKATKIKLPKAPKPAKPTINKKPKEAIVNAAQRLVEQEGLATADDIVSVLKENLPVKNKSYWHLNVQRVLRACVISGKHLPDLYVEDTPTGNYIVTKDKD